MKRKTRRIKKVDSDDKDDDYLPKSCSKEHVSVKPNLFIITRSKVVEKRNCPPRNHVAAATNNEGAFINPPKLISSSKILETNDGVSTNQAQGFTDENNPNENLDTCDSFSRCPTPFEQLERHVTVEEVQHINSRVSPSDKLVQSMMPTIDASKKNESEGAHSFHFTEFVNQDPMDENEEVESTIDQSLISVGEYLVKKEIAPLLDKIISKHKDIAKECVIKNKQSHVPYLEMICSTCQKLENSSLKDVDSTELEGMSMVVEGIQHMGLDMKWLSERIQVISEAKDLVKGHSVLKKGKKLLEMKRKEIDMLKEKLSVVKCEVLKMEIDVEEVDHDFHKQMEDLKFKGLALWGKSLLYGLI